MYFKQQKKPQNFDRGVSSLFVVIFTSVLLSIITVSFIGLMIREQQRAVDDQLSRGGYDAALSGVEDGKRVLAACRAGSAAACTAINSKSCDTVQTALGIGSATEVVVQSTSGAGSDLDQAYTCVIINRDTADYLGKLTGHDSSAIVPLMATNQFNTVKVSWYTQDDAVNYSLTTPDSPTNPRLPPLNSWRAGATSYPPIMRFQLIQHQTPVQLNDFDGNDGARTTFLFPSQINPGVINLDSPDTRRSTTPGYPYRVYCIPQASRLTYACSATITVPNANSRTSYVRLTSIYGGTNFQVQMLQNSTPVGFSDVQPSVDATGRANNVFRRVEARVEPINDDVPYPRATVDITNNFCKDFTLGNVENSYTSNCQSNLP